MRQPCERYSIETYANVAACNGKHDFKPPTFRCSRCGDPPRTVDGVAVKSGDVVWSLRLSTITRFKVTTERLKLWTYWRLAETSYADGKLAHLAAIEQATKQLKRSKQDVRRETKAIARLREAMARLTEAT